MSKRCFDLILSVAALILLFPLFILIGLMVKLGDGGPVFYRQERVGYRGKLFRIWKFRTMNVNADKAGLSITKAKDPRVTPVGSVLRRCKLDELPQFVNVVAGEMSIVGPRPEVKKYVEAYTINQRKVLSLRPGITDMASIEFRNEEELLSLQNDVESFYIDYCIPRKIEINLQYAADASIWSDVAVIYKTVLAVAGARSWSTG